MVLGFGFLEMLQEWSEPSQSCFGSLESQRRKGALETRSGGKPGVELSLPAVPRAASLVGTLKL